MDKAILYTNAAGRQVAMSVTVDGMQQGESEADYLARMVDVFVPDNCRAAAQVVDRAVADSAAEADPAALIAYCQQLCDEKLAAGFNFDFGGQRGVHRIGTTAKDMKGWDEVEKIFAAAARRNNTNKTVDIASDTGAATITLSEWNDILDAAENFRQPIWQASFVIQAKVVAGLITTRAGVAAAEDWP